MDAAKNLAVSFHAVTDDFATAVRAGRRDHVDGAFEAVEGVSFTPGGDLKRFVVVIAAHVAFSHISSLLFH
ncbi:MAG: hypothetical protein H0U99_00160 [Chthoniobacterales bacterium]|nr:hypothetical protein [Chthoniobacterales bacterium]